MAEPGARCSERELLLSQWIDCTTRVRVLLDEQLAAIKREPSSAANFTAPVRAAKADELEASRKYFDHVQTHNCV